MVRTQLNARGTSLVEQDFCRSFQKVVKHFWDSLKGANAPLVVPAAGTYTWKAEVRAVTGQETRLMLLGAAAAGGAAGASPSSEQRHPVPATVPATVPARCPLAPSEDWLPPQLQQLCGRAPCTQAQRRRRTAHPTQGDSWTSGFT